MTLTDLAALATAGYFLVFGAGFLVRPALVSRLGLRWTTEAGKTEVRAYYGGLSWALAAFMVIQVVRDDAVDAITLALLLAAAVLVTRIVGTIVDDARRDPYTRVALPTETAFVFALALVRAVA